MTQQRQCEDSRERFEYVSLENWSDTATNQGPRDAGSHQKLEKGRNGFPPSASREGCLANILIVAQ